MRLAIMISDIAIFGMICGPAGVARNEAHVGHRESILREKCGNSLGQQDMNLCFANQSNEVNRLLERLLKALNPTLDAQQ